MGAFQSKKKYDVATGESTIKGKSQPVRIDRKRENLSVFSQKNEKQVTLNTVNNVGEDAISINKSAPEVEGTAPKPPESDTKPHEIPEEYEVLVANEETVLQNSLGHQLKVPVGLEVEGTVNSTQEPQGKLAVEYEVLDLNEETTLQSSSGDQIKVSGEENEILNTDDSNKDKASHHENETISNTTRAPKESDGEKNEHGDNPISNEISQEVELKASCEEETEDSNTAQENQLNKILDEVNINENKEKHYDIIEKFIIEEKYANLGDALPKTNETVSKCDENVQEAITVLNDVIEEAADGNLVDQAPTDHQHDSAVAKEPSRKRGMIGDPPTKEEISDMSEESEKDGEKGQVSDPQIMEMHDISIVGEVQRNNKNEDKFMSHIYLENVNSDDVHYTLDKLQIMDQQIHSTRARILSIKEID